MNERLQELAEQADCEWLLEHHTKLQKFAELIVRECQLRVEQYINECGEVASMPDTVIMKHFGVEE